eukprot:m.180393 g.180393  ORF g.180393 m.180393 type:complete len:1049 (+) comp15498_c2_seq3:2026-5172(+)
MLDYYKHINNNNNNMQCIEPNEANAFILLVPVYSANHASLPCGLPTTEVGGEMHAYIFRAATTNVLSLLLCIRDFSNNELNNGKNESFNRVKRVLEYPGSSLQTIVSKLVNDYDDISDNELEHLIPASQIYNKAIAVDILTQGKCSGGFIMVDEQACCNHVSQWNSQERARVCAVLLNGDTGNPEELAIIRMMQCVSGTNRLADLLYQGGCTYEDMYSDIDGEEYAYWRKLINTEGALLQLPFTGFQQIINNDDRAYYFVEDNYVQESTNCDDIYANVSETCCKTIKMLSVDQRGHLCASMLDDDVISVSESAILKVFECKKNKTEFVEMLNYPGCSFEAIYNSFQGDEWIKMNNLLDEVMPKFAFKKECYSSYDERCASGVCGQFYTGEYRCCRSSTDWSRLGGVTEYCTALDDGDRCHKSTQCQLGSYCAGGNRCHKGKVQEGGACNENGDNDACLVGACAQKGNNDYYCCEHYGTSSSNSQQYCSNLQVNATCYFDWQCDSNWCHSESFTCKAKAKYGESCDTGWDSYCENPADTLTCAQLSDDNYKCCNISTYVEYLGEDWCGSLEVGDSCHYGFQCKSKWCHSTEAVCKAPGELGDSCDTGWDNYCNITTKDVTCAQYGNNDYRCCPFSTSYTHGGYQYCGNLNALEACHLDSQCQSTWCHSTEFVCKPKGGLGDTCDTGWDDYCVDRVNGVDMTCAQYADNDYHCCPLSTATTVGGEDFCQSLSTGTACYDTYQCLSSDFCDGTCRKKFSFGTQCESGSDHVCADGACGQWDSEEYKCCKHTSLQGGVNDWCYNLPASSSCYYYDQCESNICIANKCEANKQISGAACTRDGDCVSNSCARHEDADTFYCCNGKDEWGANSGGYQYCKSLATGTRCYYDWQCSSGWCKDNEKCVTRIATGGSCTTDNQCQSNACARHEDTNSFYCCSGSSNWDSNSGGSQYCTKLSVGTSCYYDWQCLSLWCKGNSICAERKTVGESCTYDSECGSNACARHGNNDNFYCCPCSWCYDTSWDGYYFCTSLSRYTPCYASWQCDSSSCTITCD